VEASATVMTMTAGERRGLSDRRRRPTGMLSAFTSPGRRRGFRRESEGINAYVDCPSGRTAAWAIAVVGLSAFDALLTLLHVRAGGAELVPTMRFALHHSERTFLVAKLGVTSLAVVFLAMHQNFRVARLAMRTVLALYCALIAYHIVLVALR
jgi:hypothetical protein